jgi:hypothetical protein
MNRLVRTPISVRGSKTFQRYSFTFKSLQTINVKDPVTLDNGARIDFADIVPGQMISIGNVEIVPITAVDSAVRSDILVNSTFTPLALDCPVKATLPAMCGNYVRFSNDAAITFPYTLAARSSEIIYTRDQSLVDSDKDGITNTQDLCAGTPAGTGCQRRWLWINFDASADAGKWYLRLIERPNNGDYSDKWVLFNRNGECCCRNRAVDLVVRRFKWRDISQLQCE